MKLESGEIFLLCSFSRFKVYYTNFVGVEAFYQIDTARHSDARCNYDLNWLLRIINFIENLPSL